MSQISSFRDLRNVLPARNSFSVYPKGAGFYAKAHLYGLNSHYRVAIEDVINDCIAELPNGGTIGLLGDIDETVNSPIVIDRPNLALIGESRCGRSAGDIWPKVRLTGADNVDIIQFDDSNVTQMLPSIVIKNLWLMGAGANSGHGITSETIADGNAIQRLLIKDCYFHNFRQAGRYAVYIKNPEYLKLSRNSFLSAGDAFVKIINTDYGSGNIWITENTFSPYYTGKQCINVEALTDEDIVNIWAYKNHFVMDAGDKTCTGYYLDASGGVIAAVNIFEDRFERISRAIDTTGGAGQNLQSMKFMGLRASVQTAVAAQVLINLHNRVRYSEIVHCFIYGTAADDGHTGILDAGWSTGDMANKIVDNRFMKIQTPVVVVAETVIRDNTGVNPWGIVATPFDAGSNHLEIGGGAAAPVANTDYEVMNCDIKISSTNSGGADCAIMLKDPAGNNVLQAALGDIQEMYVPRGYILNWGNFTGAAPTVTVAFI